jgi:predicted Zn-dependent peptidase
MVSNIHENGPLVKDINRILLPKIEEITFPNGISLACLASGTQEVLKLEFIFPAGRIIEDQKLAAKACAELMKEGAGSLNAFQIAEQFDFYGATLRSRANMDSISISFYSLCKHFEKLLPLLKDIFFKPTFPQEELDKYASKHIQRLKEDLSKNEILAYRGITEQIFSKNHPYGYNSSPEDYKNLTREHLKSHFSNYLLNKPFQIILSGKIDDHTIKLLSESFGNHDINTNGPIAEIQEVPKYKPSILNLSGENELQSAICIGRKLFNRKHPDFGGLYVLNTILGGYFGSRLMTNLREDKGYTYNIYSMLDALKYDGCFYVNTEVGTAFTQKAIDEIFFEFDQLIQNKVPEQELRVVKNYLKGAILRFLDGPFNQHDLVKTLKLNGLSFDYLTNLISLIEEIDAKEIQRIAARYLQKEDMSCIIVGQK